MREGKRVLGTSGNPITGLVKRHADHKNSREVMRGLCQTHRACPFGRGGGRGREGQEREDNRFVHLLRPPPQLGCVHPDLSGQWKAPPPLPPQCDKISLERVRWCNYTPPPHTPLFTSFPLLFSALTFLLAVDRRAFLVSSSPAIISVIPMALMCEEHRGRNLHRGAS